MTGQEDTRKEVDLNAQQAAAYALAQILVAAIDEAFKRGTNQKSDHGN